MQVGDYARIKKRGFQPPQIARIKSMKKDSGYHNQYCMELDHNLIPDYEFHIYEEDVDKSNSNIIDLIEEGDYVNGVEVIGFEKDNDNKEYLQCGVGDYIVCTYYEDDIKSIVTKEMFESMEYRIEE